MKLGEVSLGLTRRRFLLSSASGLAGAYLGATMGPRLAWSKDNQVKGKSLNFRVIAVGGGGDLYDGPMGGKPSTIVTEVDFSSGVIRQTQVGLTMPHSPLYLPKNRILVLSAHQPDALVLSADQKVIQKLTVPDGFVYAGHGVVLEDRGWVAVSVKRRVTRTIADTGYVAFLDLATFKERKRIDTVSSFGHDLELLAKNEVALSHYGTLLFDFQPTDTPVVRDGVKFLMNVVKPVVSYLDIEKMQFLEHRELPGTHALNHIAHGPDRSLIGISVQAVGRDPAGLKYSSDRYKDSAIPERNENDSPQNRFMFLPSPLTSISRDGTLKEVMGSIPSNQVRGHDLVSHPSERWAAATFPGSKTIGVLKGVDSMQIHSGQSLGVDAPRAIALSPDGQHLVVCDWQRGLVVLDRQTMKAVASADVPVFKVVHLDVRSAI